MNGNRDELSLLPEIMGASFFERYCSYAYFAAPSPFAILPARVALSVENGRSGGPHHST